MVELCYFCGRKKVSLLSSNLSQSFTFNVGQDNYSSSVVKFLRKKIREMNSAIFYFDKRCFNFRY